MVTGVLCRAGLTCTNAAHLHPAQRNVSKISRFIVRNMVDTVRKVKAEDDLC